MISKFVKVAAIAAFAVGISGCASNGQLSAQVQEAMNTAEAAQQTAQSAQQAANEAQQTAQSAQQTANKALSVAKDAQSTAQANSKRIERAFEESMRK